MHWVQLHGRGPGACDGEGPAGTLAEWGGEGLPVVQPVMLGRASLGPTPCFMAFFSTLIQMDGDTLCFSVCPKGHLEATEWVQAVPGCQAEPAKWFLPGLSECTGARVS